MPAFFPAYQDLLDDHRCFIQLIQKCFSASQKLAASFNQYNKDINLQLRNYCYIPGLLPGSPGPVFRIRDGLRLQMQRGV